jgi:hypothetical protein
MIGADDLKHNHRNAILCLEGVLLKCKKSGVFTKIDWASATNCICKLEKSMETFIEQNMEITL